MLNAVIVVDDEAPIREAVEQWLTLSGFEVRLFSRAEDAWRSCRITSPASSSAMCACPAWMVCNCWQRCSCETVICR